MPRVTSLEPRTPHQPGKLQKVSKNEYGFTLFSFGVNEKCGIVSSDFSIECRRFTGGCSESGAVLSRRCLMRVREGAFSRNLLMWRCPVGRGSRPRFVKIAGKTAVDKLFMVVPRFGDFEAGRLLGGRRPARSTHVSLFSARQGTIHVSGNVF